MVWIVWMWCGCAYLGREPCRLSLVMQADCTWLVNHDPGHPLPGLALMQGEVGWDEGVGPGEVQADVGSRAPGLGPINRDRVEAVLGPVPAEERPSKR